jgi:hypothetical protein
VFDPLVAADAAAQLALGTLLAPARLARLTIQHDTDPAALGVGEVLERVTGAVLAGVGEEVGRRIAYRAFAVMAGLALRGDTTPEVAAALDQQLTDVAALLAKRKARGAERAWALSLARRLADPQQREGLAKDLPRRVPIPPGDPIGEDSWMDLSDLLAP